MKLYYPAKLQSWDGGGGGRGGGGQGVGSSNRSWSKVISTYLDTNRFEI